jgi:energy-coupling factor transporter ATP-binding protein EcfA2
VAFSELERFIDQKIKNYSSGMNVRLAFSVAIHANREILLMDEVLAVGDSNFQSKCLREFAKYKEQGKTVILVTHDISTVQRYCDRAMLLRDGKVEMIGSAEEVGNEYVYQNMSDEEKRIIKEQEQAKIKAEQDMIRAQKESELLKGKALKEEKKRLEQERIRQEQEQKSLEEERKNKVAEITSVEFLDKDGKVRNVFETGKFLEIRVNIKIHKKVKELNLGIGMHSIHGACIFGCNTYTDNFLVSADTNSISLYFNNLSVLKGEYFFNFTLYGNTTEELYDFKGRFKTLTLHSLGRDNKYGGIVLMSHSWNKL